MITLSFLAGCTLGACLGVFVMALARAATT